VNAVLAEYLVLVAQVGHKVQLVIKACKVQLVQLGLRDVPVLQESRVLLALAEHKVIKAL
jgi:hypothetical protein